MTQCYYPDWEGGYTVGKHRFNKHGDCTTCGEYDPDKDEDNDGRKDK